MFGKTSKSFMLSHTHEVHRFSNRKKIRPHCRGCSIQKSLTKSRTHVPNAIATTRLFLRTTITQLFNQSRRLILSNI